MRLVLDVTSFQKALMGAGSRHEFDERGGVIGRGRRSDWVLPDPDRFVSGTHAEISFDGERFYITDVSTNGLFLNESTVPLGKGARWPVSDGDRMALGDFVIAARIIEGAPPAMSAPAMSAPAAAAPSVDIDSLLEPAAAPANTPATAPAPPLADLPAPPSPPPVAAPAPAAPAPVPPPPPRLVTTAAPPPLPDVEPEPPAAPEDEDPVPEIPAPPPIAAAAPPGPAEDPDDLEIPEVRSRGTEAADIEAADIEVGDDKPGDIEAGDDAPEDEGPAHELAGDDAAPSAPVHPDHAAAIASLDIDDLIGPGADDDPAPARAAPPAAATVPPPPPPPSRAPAAPAPSRAPAAPAPAEIPDDIDDLLGGPFEAPAAPPSATTPPPPPPPPPPTRRPDPEPDGDDRDDDRGAARLLARLAPARIEAGLGLDPALGEAERKARLWDEFARVYNNLLADVMASDARTGGRDL